MRASSSSSFGSRTSTRRSLRRSPEPFAAQQPVKGRVANLPAHDPALGHVAFLLEPEAFERALRSGVARIDVRFEAIEPELAEGEPDERDERLVHIAAPPVLTSE